MRQLVWTAKLALLATGSLLATGCATVTWVNDVSTSPDGQMVTVVGAEMRPFMGGLQATRPVRWVCLRNETGRLGCMPDASELPEFDEDAPPPPAPMPAAPAAAPPPPPPKAEPVEQPEAPPPAEEPPAPAAAGCANDGECKGSRICKDGQCVAP